MRPNSIFHNFIDNIIDLFSPDEELLRNIFERKDFRNWTNPTFKELDSVAKNLDVTIEKILTDSIDYNLVAKYIYKKPPVIPDKYLGTEGTYMSTIRASIDYTRMKYNSRAADNLRRSLQLSKETLSSNLMVNSNLINDLLETMENYYSLSEADLSGLAIHMYKKTGRKKALELCSKDDNDANILQQIANNSSTFEKNFSYSLEVQSDGVYVLKSISNENINDYFKRSTISSYTNNKLKAAIICQFGSLLGRHPLHLMKIDDYSFDGRQHCNYFFKETVRPPDPANILRL